MASGEAIRCPIWHSPLIRVVPDGIEFTCKSCRGAIHRVSRAELERMWSEMAQTQAITEQVQIKVLSVRQ